MATIIDFTVISPLRLSFVVRTQSQRGMDESYVQLARKILGTKTNSIFFRRCKTKTAIVIVFESLRCVKPENVNKLWKSTKQLIYNVFSEQLLNV